MCGIGGIRKFGNDPIPVDSVTSMLLGLQNRGIDATGVALIDKKGKVTVFKRDQSAWVFTSDKAYEKFMQEHLTEDINTIILHTRSATKGNPRENENNHPMFTNKCAVVHNGVISNDDNLFTDMKLDRGAKTDSDILRAIVDKEGFNKKVVRQLNRVCGSVACAVLNPEMPEHLLLVRSGSPLVLAQAGDFLVFASEKKYIHASMRPWITRWGVWFQKNSLPDIAFVTMPDNTAWLFGPKGLEWHDECKTTNYYHEPIRHINDGFAERQRRWDNEARAKESNLLVATEPERTNRVRAKCPKCGKLNRVDPKFHQTDLALFNCGQCEEPLAPITRV